MLPWARRHASLRLSGRLAFLKCPNRRPRHFVPGYYQPVPPGQKPLTHRAPRIKLALMGRAPAWSRRQTSDGRVPCSASDGRCAPARPALHVSMRHLSFVFGPFHYCASCERATPDAPETIYDQRRFTGACYRTICGGSRGSASLPMMPVLTFCGLAAADRPPARPYRRGLRSALSGSLRSSGLFQFPS